MSNKIENGLSSSEQMSKLEIRELRPEEFWNGSITVENVSDEEFAQKISEAANELGYTYSGYRLPKEGQGFDYHFSRYPRRAFGPVAPISKHQEALHKLAEKLGGEVKEEKTGEQSRIRVLFGLQEGYNEYKKQSLIKRLDKGEIATLEDAKKIIDVNIGDISEYGINFSEIEDLQGLKTALEQTNFGKNHTFEEIQNELGEAFNLTPAEIYSVGPWGKYTEPAVLIEGDKSQLDKIYVLANKFHQARIAVDDLHLGQSYMVETRYCEDPDKE